MKSALDPYLLEMSKNDITVEKMIYGSRALWLRKSDFSKVEKMMSDLGFFRKGNLYTKDTTKIFINSFTTPQGAERILFQILEN